MVRLGHSCLLRRVLQCRLCFLLQSQLCEFTISVQTIHRCSGCKNTTFQDGTRMFRNVKTSFFVGTFINTEQTILMYMPIVLFLFFLTCKPLLKAKNRNINMHNIIVMGRCFGPFKNCVNAKLAKLHFVDYCRLFVRFNQITLFH